jgi:hypothetical protein
MQRDNWITVLKHCSQRSKGTTTQRRKENSAKTSLRLCVKLFASLREKTNKL